MHPILFKIGPLTIYSYGAMLALGIAISTSLAARRAAKSGLHAGIIYDLVIWLVLSMIAGARALYVLLHLGEFRAEPISAFAIQRGGLVLYGGLLLAIFAGWVFARVKGVTFWKLADLMAPYIALGLAIGRLGCFLNGCCYGKRTDFVLAVRFPGLEYPVHPVQIYESLFCLLVFFYLLWLRNKRSSEKGNFLRFLLLYSVGRFLVEFFRGDNPAFLGNLTLPQLFSMAIFALSAVLLRLRKSA